MNKKAQRVLWTSLFLIVGGFFLFFLVNFFIDAMPYFRLDSSTRGYIEDYSVKRLSYDQYGVQVHYFYTVGEKEFERSQTLKTPIFMNPYGAQSHIEKYWKDKEWTVWYQKSAPYYASLQRLFPFKYFFNSLVLFFVLVYFYGLRRSQQKYSALN